MLSLTETAPQDLSYLGPLVAAIGAVLVALVSGLAVVWRQHQDRKDVVVDRDLEKLPTEVDGWTEVRAARAEATRYYNLYRVFEDLYYTVSSALRHLARLVHDNHPDEQFSKDVTDALAVKPPNDDTPTA